MKKILILFSLCALVLCSNFASVNAADFYVPDDNDVHTRQNTIFLSADRKTFDKDGYLAMEIHDEIRISADFELFTYISGSYIMVGGVVPKDDGSIDANCITPINQAASKPSVSNPTCKLFYSRSQNYKDGVAQGWVEANPWHKDYGESSFNLYASTIFSDDMYYSSGYCFASLSDAKNYYLEGNEDGVLIKPVDPTPIPDENSLKLETPIIALSNREKCEFKFMNAEDGYIIEIQGRWWTVDDITVYKENLIWKYKYDSLIKGNLNNWISFDNDVSAIGIFNYYSLGKNSLDALLSAHPVDNRSIIGGTNAVGNYFSGYNDALDTFKMLLNAPSMYVAPEMYARYKYVDVEGNTYYSKWGHYVSNLAKQNGSSGSDWDDDDDPYTNDDGLTDDDKDKLEADESSRHDPGLKPVIDTQLWDDSTTGFLEAMNQVFKLFQSLFGLMGSVPAMVSSVFGFLPSWFITFISISLALVVFLRIIGR